MDDFNPDNQICTNPVSEKKTVIPVFLPHYGCHHRCLFCHQPTLTGHETGFPGIESVRKRIETYLKLRKNPCFPAEIAFFGGNVLGLAKNRVEELLETASRYLQKGDGIRISTRPDSITRETLSRVRPFPVSTIELGVQSMNDRTLAILLRGHNEEDVVSAVSLIREMIPDCSVGLQIMTGLPAETREMEMESAGKVAALSPDFVRIFPTLVLKNSGLEDLYQKGEYTPPGLEETIDRVKDIYLLFTQKGIKITRMGLQATTDLNDGAHVLAGPYHPAFGHLVISKIYLDKAMAAIRRNRIMADKIEIRVSPGSISRMRGDKNQNMEILKKTFGFKIINVTESGEIPGGILGDCIRVMAV